MPRRKTPAGWIAAIAAGRLRNEPRITAGDVAAAGEMFEDPFPSALGSHGHDERRSVRVRNFVDSENRHSMNSGSDLPLVDVVRFANSDALCVEPLQPRLSG